jgi:predicted DNA-binding transcriptional regulator AlpA
VVFNVSDVKENQGSALESTSKRQTSPCIAGLGEAIDGRSPLLLTAKQAATMVGKSLRTWRTWDSAGWIPRPVRIGRSTLWRADELREWVAAGCPRRAEWEARQ